MNTSNAVGILVPRGASRQLRSLAVLLGTAFCLLQVGAVRAADPVPPAITSQPTNRTARLAESAAFSVAATGTEPLTYAWRKDGLDLSGMPRFTGVDAATLTITDLQMSDAGLYSVVVSNAGGSITSALAILTVLDRLPPSLVISSHVDGQLLATASVALAGSATDADRGDGGIKSVTVNGLRATNDTAAGSATANWSRKVALVAGTNSVRVVATDTRGNATTNRIRLIADLSRPTLSITAPKPSQRWGQDTFTVTGKAGVNRRAGEVFVQINGGAWQSAVGFSNWTATVSLVLGTNTVRAFAVDTAGNPSLTNTVRFVYVLSAPITLDIVGKGKILGATNGQWIELLKPVSLTNSPSTGYKFLNWQVQLPGTNTLSTNRTLKLVMAANLAVTATFLDVAKPTLTLTAPTANQRLTTNAFTVRGKVTDNGPAGEVQWQLNGGQWHAAVGWSNWTATAALVPGTNTIRAFAMDAAGNRSTTNTVRCVHVVTAPITIHIVGKGKVLGATNGQRLEILKPVSLTNSPSTGYKFVNWLVQIDGTNTLSTNRAIKVMMVSNLVVTATFLDVAKPTLTITAPTANQFLTNRAFTVAGKVADNGLPGEVQCQLNGGAWQAAAGWSNWTAAVSLVPGSNTIRAVAIDAAGNHSSTSLVRCVYGPPGYLLTYFPLHDGDWKTFTGPVPDSRLSVIRRIDGSFNLAIASDGVTANNYVRYSDSNRKLLLTGGSWEEQGITLTMNPPLVYLDETVLLNGGSRSSSSTTFYGGLPISLNLKVSVTNAGTVTVPTGTYQDCKQVHITVTAFVPFQPAMTFSSEAYTLAPRVGPIRVGVFETSGSSVQFIGWDVLTDGTVNGVDVRDLTGGFPVGIPEVAGRIQMGTQRTASLPLEFRLSGLVISGGSIQLRLPASAGSEVVIESSADLLHWVPVQTNTVPADGLTLTLPIDQRVGARFFRAKTP